MREVREMGEKWKTDGIESEMGAGPKRERNPSHLCNHDDDDEDALQEGGGCR